MSGDRIAGLLISHRSGYWGTEPGEKDFDARVIRNGDVNAEGRIEWVGLPVRGLSSAEVAKARVEPGDIILTTSGDCGYVAYVSDEPAELTCASNFVRVLRADRGKVQPKYLFHWMSRAAFRASLAPYIRGTAMQNLSLPVAMTELLVPLPSRAEQTQIADTLDHLDVVREKRQAGIVQLDALAQSIFLDMFGAPLSDKWPLTTIEDVAARRPAAIRTGPFGSQLLHSEFTDVGVAVLGIDNAVHNEFRWGKPRYISEEKYQTLARYRVYPGDVLITIMGTYGRCAIVPDDIPIAINTKHLCCISLDQTRCLPVFLHDYFLYHPMSRRHLVRAAKGAIMDGLNMTIIRGLPLQLPPLAMQARYAERIAVVDAQRSVERQSLSAITELVASVQARAFEGHL